MPRHATASRKNTEVAKTEDQMNLIRDARGRVIVRTIRVLLCGALGGLGAWFLISGLIDLNQVSNNQNGTIFQQQFSMLEIIGGGLLIGILLLVLAVGKKAK